MLENDEVDDDDDDAMVLDGETNNITAQDIRDSCFDDDEASLNLRDSDDDTETNSMMVVSIMRNMLDCLGYLCPRQKTSCSLHLLRLCGICWPIFHLCRLNVDT